MTDLPTVTVLIPAKNEEADIGDCLEAVLAQDYPHDHIEIVLVDGASADRTAAAVRRVLECGDITWKIVDNLLGTTPSNLNAGLAVATGDIVCRVDARSVVPTDYVRLCAELLRSRPDVMVTGGAQIALARNDSSRAVGIARALNNRYAMGGSRYRSGSDSGPTDTVYMGAFRSAQLRAAGGWDEALLSNQDFDLNRRMSRSGIVWFDDRLAVGYVPRQRLCDLWQQYHRFGRWKVRYWRHSGDRPLGRQFVVLMSAPITMAGAGLAVAAGRSRLRRLVAVAAAGVGLASVVERRGASQPEGSFISHALATTALITVGSGWLSGVACELASSQRLGAARSLVQHQD